MALRGKQSAAALAIIPTYVEAIERPQAPAELTREEAEEWVQIVNRMSADWFPRETHGLLVCYCRHVVRGRRLASMIEQLEQGDELDSSEYRRMLTAEADNSRTVMALATKMRFSQQSTADRRRPKPQRLSVPWNAD